MELAEIYEKTADVIEERGLAGQALEDGEGRLCVFGAVHVVLYGSPNPDADAHRGGACGRFEDDIRARLGRSPVNWSDDMASMGQADEVVACLREFAAQVRRDAPVG